MAFASEGVSARNLLNTVHYDLVLLDRNLADMSESGIDLLQEIRASQCIVPVIMMSAQGERESIKEGLRAGADDYLAKPIDLEELELRIKRQIQRSPTLMRITELSYYGGIFTQSLYNNTSSKYEEKWQEDQAYKNYALNEKLFWAPLEDSLYDKSNPLVYDLACGTGRFSKALLRKKWFQGILEAVDFSEGMLDILRRDLSESPEPDRDRVKIRCEDLSLWMPDRRRKAEAVIFVKRLNFCHALIVL
ncbi:MAG: response regulator [Candidatus Caenarcaniphilales bacterium]|nr:response regulator [Candidatus Caenarcaniphilales bacterium]